MNGDGGGGGGITSWGCGAENSHVNNGVINYDGVTYRVIGSSSTPINEASGLAWCQNNATWSNYYTDGSGGTGNGGDGTVLNPAGGN